MVLEFWKLNKIELKRNEFDLNGIWDIFVVWELNLCLEIGLMGR